MSDDVSENVSTDIRDKSIESEAVPSTHAYGQYQNVFLSDAELVELGIMPIFKLGIAFSGKHVKVKI